MKITNKTHWRTDQIRALILRVAKDELDPGQIKGRGHVTIKYRRANGCYGRCTYGTASHPRIWMTLCLPRFSDVDTVQVAKTIAHELGHAKGIRHKDMKNTRYGWVDGWRERYAWAAAFPIQAAPPKTKARPTADDKLAKAQDKVTQWETKIKRANTMLKKWKTKVRYYERRIAPVEASPEIETGITPQYQPQMEGMTA